MVEQLRPGQVVVCIHRLNWPEEPYYGQRAKVTSHLLDQVGLVFLDDTEHPRNGEHLFHRGSVATEAEWDLVRSTKGVS